jgi:hypothetical protein
VADGVAVDAQHLCHLLAGLGWPAGQEVEPLEPWLLAAIMRALQALFQGLSRFRHDGEGFAHRLFA